MPGPRNMGSIVLPDNVDLTLDLKPEITALSRRPHEPAHLINRGDRC